MREIKTARIIYEIDNVGKVNVCAYLVFDDYSDCFVFEKDNGLLFTPSKSIFTR